MKAIKHTLTERYYAWEDARQLAETDPEVDLSNVHEPYTPGDYLEEEAMEELEASEAEAAEAAETAEKTESIDPSTLPKSSEAQEQQPTARP
jgi:large subunit ribosomal protein L47